MKQVFKKWWFWLIVVLVILIILLFPIWCRTVSLPGINDTLVEKVYCENLFGLGKVY